VSRLVLVRHGEAAAGWGDHHDPGLSETGRAQAASMASALAPLGPLPVIVSPLRRTRETAQPLTEQWKVEPVIEPAVAEIPPPTDDLAERAVWLGRLFRTPWDQWPADVDGWRQSVRDALLAIDQDAVVVTHFVAIRVAADDGSYMPDYCSRTVVDSEGGRLRVVELGQQRTTVVR
jgi:broad specificity phosphatase PhoE